MTCCDKACVEKDEFVWIEWKRSQDTTSVKTGNCRRSLLNTNMAKLPVIGRMLVSQSQELQQHLGFSTSFLVGKKRMKKARQDRRQ